MHGRPIRSFHVRSGQSPRGLLNPSPTRFVVYDQGVTGFARGDETASMIRIVIDQRGVEKGEVEVTHVVKARGIPSCNALVSYPMATLLHSPCLPGEGISRRRQPKENQHRSVTCSATAFQETRMSASRASCLERKALACLRQRTHAIEHQATCKNRAAGRIEWRNSACNFVSIDELANGKACRQ